MPSVYEFERKKRKKRQVYRAKGALRTIKRGLKKRNMTKRKTCKKHKR